jgi:anti-anti-sigma regulatory factor
VSHVVAEIQRIKDRRRGLIVDKMTSGPYAKRFLASFNLLSGLEDGTIFAFVDDLHNSCRAYCKELWTALIPLKIKWGAQCTLFLGDEPEMVKLAAESGCVSMFVGMESIIEESIEETNKPFNRIAQYVREIKCFHDHGIMLNPGIIFGFDHDDESVFDRTVEFLVRNRMELAYFNILTPLPGTALFERMKSEGRIFDFDWAKYDGKNVVFWPKRMSPETLQEGFFWANHKFFSWTSIARRMLPTPQRFVARAAMNVAFRHLVKRTAPKGSLSPLSQVIQNLHVKLPSLATENLIPNALNTLREKAADAAQQIDRFLHIQVKKGDIARTAEAATAPLRAALHLDLVGTLDELGARELRKRLLDAVSQAKKVDIVINFENVRHATPQAVHALLDGEYLKALKVNASVKFINLKTAFQAALDRMTSQPALWSDETIG